MRTETVLQKHLAEIDACREARIWADKRTPQEAWDDCVNSEWLFWWAAQTRVNSSRTIVRALLPILRHTLPLFGVMDMEPLRAIIAAELWADDPDNVANYERCVSEKKSIGEFITENDYGDERRCAIYTSAARAIRGCLNIIINPLNTIFADGVPCNAAFAFFLQSNHDLIVREKVSFEFCQLARPLLTLPYAE